MKSQDSPISKYFLFAGIVILLIFNCYLLCKRVVIVSGNAENDKSGVDANTKYITTTIDYMENSGLPFGDSQIVDVLTHTPVDIDHLFSKSGKDHLLICRISEYDCDQCVSYAVQKVMKHINDSTLNMKVVLFGQYDNEMSLKIIGEQLAESGKIDCYLVSSVNIPIEEHVVPYYFVIDREKKVTDAFAPDRMTPQLTDLYFAQINRKWSKLPE